MAHVVIEGYLCERCGYRWAPRNGTGLRDKDEPKLCPKCKSSYWNRPRKNNYPIDKRASGWEDRRTIQTAA
jgi:predicted Zn-ribbon and HTH transcriptional regulator